MKRATVAFFAVAAMAMVGCTQRIGDFTVMSSKNVSITGNRGDRVKGLSCIPIIFFVPIGKPDLKSAVDRAIESAGPGFDALEDVVLSNRGWWFLLAGESCYVVEGTAVSTKGGKAMLDRPGNMLLHSSLLQSSGQTEQLVRLQGMKDSADAKHVQEMAGPNKG
jgi:hypothetical protein